MAIEKQETVTIPLEQLLERAARLAADGYRLVQICCTRLGAFQVDYTFDKDYGLLNLRVIVPADRAEIPSISGVYWSAFTYENEICDLFGVRVKDMEIDYGGNFYRLEVKAPFGAGKPKGGDPGGGHGR